MKNNYQRFCRHVYVKVPRSEYTYSDLRSLAMTNPNLVLVKCKLCGQRKWVYKQMLKGDDE